MNTKTELPDLNAIIDRADVVVQLAAIADAAGSFDNKGDIIQLIKQHIPHLDIEYVDTEIMNQLSYEVLNYRFANQGFKSTGSIKKSIKETIELLWSTGGNCVK